MIEMLTLDEMLALADRVPKWTPYDDPDYDFRQSKYNNHDGTSWTSITDKDDDLRYLTIHVGVNDAKDVYITCRTAYVDINTNIQLGRYCGNDLRAAALLKRIRKQNPEKMAAGNFEKEVKRQIRSSRERAIKKAELNRIRSLIRETVQ